MTCHHVRESLQAYLDGDCGEAIRGRIEAHLASCRGCRHEFGLLRAADAALAGEQLIDPPYHLAPVIVAKAAARARLRRRLLVPVWLEALTFLGAGAATVLFSLIALGLLQAASGITLTTALLAPTIVAVIATAFAGLGAVYYQL
jgi:anti-sigma factor RsiW